MFMMMMMMMMPVPVIQGDRVPSTLIALSRLILS